MRRSFHFLHGYAAVGVALVGNMIKDAYMRAQDVCEMFPQFEFLPTFQDEILLHHTRLPLLNMPVSTVAVVAALLTGFVATYLRLIEMLWLFLFDFFSGRWLYNLFYVHIPAWLPFLASEPSVPDLLSDPEDADELGNAPLDAAACAVAMAKLVEVKLQHANHTIERPDDWLVFDPEEEQLVTKKHLEAKRLRRNQSAGSTSSASTTSTAPSSPTSPASSPTKKHSQSQADSSDEDPTDAEVASHDEDEGPVRRKR